MYFVFVRGGYFPLFPGMAPGAGYSGLITGHGVGDTLFCSAFALFEHAQHGTAGQVLGAHPRSAIGEHVDQVFFG